MIEIVVGAGLVLAGVLVARALRRARDDEPTKTPSVAPTAPAPPASPPKRLGPRGLRPDDVLLYADTELWLAGMLDLDEEGFVCRMFRTPGSPRADWVAQLDARAEDIALMRETKEVPKGRVPESLPIGGYRLTLERRGHAHVRAEGAQLPRTSDEADYTILSGAGGRTLIVIDFHGADRLALAGERVGREMLELLPGGDAAKMSED